MLARCGAAAVSVGCKGLLDPPARVGVQVNSILLASGASAEWANADAPQPLLSVPPGLNRARARTGAAVAVV